MAETRVNLKFRHPFSMRVIGPSGAGKTFFVRKLLENLDHCTEGLPSRVILWAHGQPQDVHKVPLKGVKVNYFEGLPSSEDIAEVKPSVLVIDDLAVELERDKRLAKIFTKESHHLGISVIFLLQNLYPPGPIMRVVSLNSHHDIIFNSPRDARQIMSYASQLRPGNVKSFMEAYQDAVNKARGYIVVYLKGDIPDKYRIATRILRDELPEELRHLNFAPIIYIPK